MEVISLDSSFSRNTNSLSIKNDKKSVADIVVETLLSAGVTKVFGIPGGATIPLHVSMEKQEQIEFILTKHEGGAAFMADCYSRMSGKLGVCCSTTGPGATNLMTGVASAYMDSIPMLVITGMNPTDSWGRGDFQESTPYAGTDTTDMFKSICKHSEIIISEKILQFRLRNAIATAQSGRPGPVHLAIPRDLWSKKISPEYWLPASYLSQPPSASAQDVALTADLLRKSSQPLVLFGSGASADAVSCLMAVCEHLSIPIASTPRAKGKDLIKISSTYIGSIGIAATTCADNLFANNRFDVILTVGAGFGSYATNSWDIALLATKAMIQVNIDPGNIGQSFPVDLGIVADGQQFSEQLFQNVMKFVQDKQVDQRANWLVDYLQDDVWPLPEEYVVNEAGLPSPVEIIRAVDQAVGERGAILSDSNSILLWATHYLPERKGRRFISAWGGASMGHATAGAIGAKLAAPDSDVVAIVGDGCFLMNGNEVATAVDLNLPVVWVINANMQLGMIHYELRAGGCTQSATLSQYDLAAFARSLGAVAEHCKDISQLAGQIAAGFNRTKPTVIQVDVDPEPVPPLGRKKTGSANWKSYITGI